MPILIAVILVSCNFLAVSSASALSCIPSNFICPETPDSVVSCECHGATTSLRWRVTSSTGTQLLRETYFDTDITGVSASANGYTIVLCSVVTGIRGINLLTSRLNFTFAEGVSVECLGNIRYIGRATLQTAGKIIVATAYMHACIIVLL